MPHDEDERARRHDPQLARARSRVESHLLGLIAFPIWVLLALTITGCAHDGREPPLFVTMAPPPEPIELAGSPPSPVYVWARGQYNWNGFEYVWTPGHWRERPHVRAVWIAGHWRKTHRGWTFVEGHWS
jgi:hypothetical protein